MDKIKCIVVDDEEGAHLVITHFLKDIRTLSLEGSFYNAIDALDYLYKNKVDLVFLDINMPGLSGLEMLETLTNRPFIILTTAYKQYALDGYKYEVVDYLVKPFEFKKFLQAIDKVMNRKGIQAKMPAVEETDHLILKVDGTLTKIPFSKIIYIQSFGNYVKIFIEDGMLISQMTTSEIEERLSTSLFLRIHKSYIVSLKQIQKVSGTQVVLKNNTELPIGNTFKRELLAQFK
ncbi:LytTR family DNA-binding domain-containing protein [Terrimonas sp. NA20]|uniref:LytTR family DNA-binding domain-containing protein n=1 Tax=Terrimonas ginsenosidimutans TaxID=2908004 RepID=A0ABS9KMA7_9BACT|nr:LytTR family DNA-binding domain-containing protein [Terrimonas ginsenosidimutans]MCG2613449.1 LytTR family DNA-binding domain-containing protein [Terrimonas ginsenosidimutans]